MPRKKSTAAVKLDNLNDLALNAHKRITAAEGEIARIAFMQASAEQQPVDKAKEVAALVGLWIERQQAAGQTAVDLNRVKDVRAGIELALT